MLPPTSETLAIPGATASPGDPASPSPRLRSALTALRLFLVLLGIALASTFFVQVPVGERGVLLRLGAVQERILGEGLHVLPPGIFSVKPLSVRVQSHFQKSEAATRDLQDVKIDLVVQWHLPADRVQHIYQNLGDLEDISAAVLEPLVEDSLKSIVAALTAEQLITERPTFRANLEALLAERLSSFDLVLDGADLVQLDFSSRFRAAVEAKQVAEQDSRKAAFEAVKAQRQAAARVYLAEGEAKAQELLQKGLSGKLLSRQAIEKWDGQMPLVVGNDTLPWIDLKSMLNVERERQRRRQPAVRPSASRP